MAHFTSCCGGFPAPDANTNPWGYKFSWSHRGVFLAGRNPARYLKNGALVEIPGEELFDYHWPYQVEGQGVFEMYPNRDSLDYIEPYGLSKIQGMFRGTLRYPGWCKTMRALGQLSMFELDEHDWPEGTTYLDVTTRLLPPGPGAVIDRLADHLGISSDSYVIARLEWAGLLSDRVIPERRAAPLDIFANRLAKMMVYAPGERDMIALRHTFRASYPDGHTDDVTSSMVDTGIPFGDTAMARTVSLPAAIATRLYLEGEMEVDGVQIPTLREIYDPVLQELDEQGLDLHSSRKVAEELVTREALTRWQADQLLQGRHRGFFLGPYRLLKLLGKGGMGTVYLAEHQMLRRRCAIKVLPSKQVRYDSSTVDRFYREAQAVAALDHPNIVKAYDVNKVLISRTEYH